MTARWPTELRLNPARDMLTIRFEDGKHPAFQVVAEGMTLYVTIQDV